jgi:hypothetical protein
MLKKVGARPEKRLKNDAKRELDPKHLDFIRKLPCLAGGKGPVEAAHIRMADAKRGKPLTGIGVRPDDRYAVPLSKAAHDRQHRLGEIAFWSALKIDPLEVADALWAISGDVEAGRRIVTAARAGAKR